MLCQGCRHHPQTRRINVARRYDTHEEQLIAYVRINDISGVRRKLAAGARVNGCNQLEDRPIISAASKGSAAVTKLLLKEGADLESALPKDKYDCDGDLVLVAGARPLHVAAQYLNLDVFRVLVRAGASLNAPDSQGSTPLMLATKAAEDGEDQEERQARLVLLRELLEAGADPTVRNKEGWSAVHFAARLEDPEPLKMLTWQLPESISFSNDHGQSPLWVAAWFGRAKIVFHLLAMAEQHHPTLHVRECPCERCSSQQCPLRVAACGGHVDALRLLMDAAEALGGLEVTIPSAIQATCTAASKAYTEEGENPERWVGVLQMLLAVEGEERKGHWAKSWYAHSPVLHHAAVSGTLATISLLLAAGADETVLNLYEQTASEVMCEPHDCRTKSPAEKAATRRMLARGPAFRARSWVWPAAVDAEDEEDAGDHLAGVVDASSSGKGRAQHAPLGVRIWRSGDRKRFVRLIERCLRAKA